MARAPQRDLTTGPIGRTLLLFALPTLGSSVLQSLNGSINAIWIGQFLGEGALAATTNANIIMFLLIAAVFGFGMAATILIGQNMGRGDVAAVRRVLGTSLRLFGVLSLVTAVVGLLAAPAILRLLATPADVYALALGYLRVIFVAMVPGFLSVLLTMALRGTGDSITPLKFMALGSAVDVALNPLLIRGWGPIPALGIEGSATATLIANTVSLVALLAYVYARDLPIRLRGAEWRYILPDAALLRTIVVKGVPMGLQMLVVSTSALAMIGLVNRHGTATTAAYGAANQLWTYIQMPAMAVGAAVSAMAAQNIGAGAWERVGRITRAGILTNLALTGGLVVAVTLLDRHILWLFLGQDSAAVAIAVRINLIAAWSFVLFGVSMVLSATVRANGAVIGPLAILAVAMFPLRLGMAAGLAPSWGADAIWWSFPAGSLGSMLLMIAFYRHGGWRRGRLPVARHEGEEKALADGQPAARSMPAG
ncbi:putative MATE family efflux protein [Sphingomonas sp. BE138]|uniref:MATE family efflux transporter n=1 Tax=Sphingomonas sp. BE138 TaxID=2817845 RepID=UPI00285B6276|nr:MATE family efflux transporter [Sphingomonas sp. BE138]MDR6788730.1 putative MATE family efflux protein [Sphingomonas sp. BE138]